MKYMLLIYSSPESWAGLTTEQRKALGRSHQELRRELVEQGMLVSSAGLADPITTRTVTVAADGARTTTDGPFAETKEHLAGFYLVECEDVEQALDYAARMPDARYLAVEVRPVMDVSGLEM